MNNRGPMMANGPVPSLAHMPMSVRSHMGNAGDPLDAEISTCQSGEILLCTRIGGQGRSATYPSATRSVRGCPVFEQGPSAFHP
jgi:hypothetical protein